MINAQQIQAMKRLREEFDPLHRSPNSNYGITIGLPDENDIFHWKATLAGPKDSSYAGGIFFLNIEFPKDYPKNPPEVCFKTPIYHVNVNPKNSSNGEKLGHVCISTLNWWKPEYKMKEVLSKIYGLFYMANPDSPYGLEIGIELRNNKTLYEEKAQYFTKKYAHPNQCNNGNNYTDSWDFTYIK